MVKPTPKKLVVAEVVLPKSVYFKHGAYFYVSPDRTTGKQQWLPLGKEWNSEAKKKWRSFVLRHRTGTHSSKILYSEGDGLIPLEILRQQMTNAKKNAKARGLEFTLILDDLKAMAETSHGKCALSGLPFEYGNSKELFGTSIRRKKLWSPSLDRIDCDLGYTQSNVRLVCMAVNIARQEFGDEVLFKIAHALSNIQCFSKKYRPAASMKSSTYGDPNALTYLKE
jgi:hypothetical protein